MGYAFALGIIGIPNYLIHRFSNDDKSECLNCIKNNFEKIHEFDGGYSGRDNCTFHTIAAIGKKMNWDILSNCTI